MAEVRLHPKQDIAKQNSIVASSTKLVEFRFGLGKQRFGPGTIVFCCARVGESGASDRPKHRRHISVRHHWRHDFFYVVEAPLKNKKDHLKPEAAFARAKFQGLDDSPARLQIA